MLGTGIFALTRNRTRALAAQVQTWPGESLYLYSTQLTGLQRNHSQSKQRHHFIQVQNRGLLRYALSCALQLYMRCLHFDMCRRRQFTTDIEGTAIVGHLEVVLGAFVPQRRGRCLSDAMHLLTFLVSTVDNGQLVVQTRGD